MLARKRQILFKYNFLFNLINKLKHFVWAFLFINCIIMNILVLPSLLARCYFSSLFIQRDEVFKIFQWWPKMCLSLLNFAVSKKVRAIYFLCGCCWGKEMQISIFMRKFYNFLIVEIVRILLEVFDSMKTWRKEGGNSIVANKNLIN